MPALSHILSAIPLWVVPLLFGLIFLGRRAQFERSSPVFLIYALPLLGLLSLNRAISLGDLASAALLAGWAAGVALGLRLQPRWSLSRSQRRVQLRGEHLTMVTVLGLFALNFAAGMAQGMAPNLATGTMFGGLFGAVAGGLSGSLAGRAIHIARMPVTGTDPA
ncbi:MAG: hypothetical protein N4A53_00405 [Pelagimonas sp.]|jgi:hypothetical protein|nr:hypothetical protein [Pelagimonas sp.]